MGRSPSEHRVWGESSLDGISLLRARYLDHRFRLHSQDSYVIGVNLGGQASCFADPGLDVGPGTVVIVPPGEPHAGHRASDEPWVYCAAYPTTELLQEVYHSLTGRTRTRPEFSRLLYPDPELAQRFVRAHEAFLCGKDPLLGESALVEFLGTLLVRYGKARPLAATGGEGTAVSRSIEYLRANLDSPLSLADLAGSTGYSRYHFLRIFKRQTGHTPHAYLMQRRVERARELLRQGSRIVDAAFDSGFADQPHLTRRFKEVVGVTPGEYQAAVGSRTPPLGPGRARSDRAATASKTRSGLRATMVP